MIASPGDRIVGRPTRPLAWVVLCIVAGTMLEAGRRAYGDFSPLRGYDTVHAHLMASTEGFFLAYYSALGLVTAIGLAAVLWSCFSWGPVAQALARPGWKQWIVAASAAVSVVGAWAVGTVVLQGAFLTDDEMAMLFQARTLAQGRLWAPPPPFVDSFEYAMMVESPRWYGIYPPGHPAMMAISLAFTGNERTVLVLGAALWVLLTYRLGRRLFDGTTGVIASVLLTTSPFFLLSSGSRASELTSGLFLLAAANLAVSLNGPGRPARAVGLGLALGAAYLARPYTALVLALPWVLVVASRWWRRHVAGWSLLAVVGAALPVIALYLATNAELTGSPWLTPYEVNFPGRFRLGFGQDAFGIIHTPHMAWTIAALTLGELNTWVLGWPLSLAPVVVAAVWDRPRRHVLLLLAGPLCLIVAHLPVPMAGVHDTGPLYYLETLPALVIVAARGLVIATRGLARWASPKTAELVPWLAVSSALVGAVFFTGQNIRALGRLAQFNNGPYELAEQVIDGPAIVFVETIQTVPPSSWVLGLRPPRPDLSDRLLFVHVARPSRVRKIMASYPSRRAYYLRRDGVTGGISLLPLPAVGGGPAGNGRTAL